MVGFLDIITVEHKEKMQNNAIMGNIEHLRGPVINALHGDWPEGMSFVGDDNIANISNTAIDATDRYAVSAVIDVRRNFSELRFPSCCSNEERLEVERMAAAALSGSGVYLPLRGSESHLATPGGMALNQESHFDNENDMKQQQQQQQHGLAKLEGIKACATGHPSVVMPCSFTNLLAQLDLLKIGREPNLGCTNGHPSVVMSCSFASGRLLNLGCNTGRPFVVMSCSFANLSPA